MMVKCEICGTMGKGFMSYNHQDRIWRVTCVDCDQEGYWIPLDELQSASGVDRWVEHLSMKNWFIQDEFLIKLDAATVHYRK